MILSDSEKEQVYFMYRQAHMLLGTYWPEYVHTKEVTDKEALIRLGALGPVCELTLKNGPIGYNEKGKSFWYLPTVLQRLRITPKEAISILILSKGGAFSSEDTRVDAVIEVLKGLSESNLFNTDNTTYKSNLNKPILKNDEAPPLLQIEHKKRVSAKVLVLFFDVARKAGEIKGYTDKKDSVIQFGVDWGFDGQYFYDTWRGRYGLTSLKDLNQKERNQLLDLVKSYPKTKKYIDNEIVK
jgi:hypothetical protein